ncbi:MAG: hypothetical protein L6Q98_16900 [Anaerolineae bacterium]|nr:hypothetical protein [Anaerolineae bacterium]
MHDLVSFRMWWLNGLIALDATILKRCVLLMNWMSLGLRCVLPTSLTSIQWMPMTVSLLPYRLRWRGENRSFQDCVLRVQRRQNEPMVGIWDVFLMGSSVSKMKRLVESHMPRKVITSSKILNVPKSGGWRGTCCWEINSLSKKLLRNFTLAVITIGVAVRSSK